MLPLRILLRLALLSQKKTICISLKRTINITSTKGEVMAAKQSMEEFLQRHNGETLPVQQILDEIGSGAMSMMIFTGNLVQIKDTKDYIVRYR